jgi:hypothetical protein
MTDPIEKMGRYMATTTRAIPQPTTKIINGSKTDVKVATVAWYSRATRCSRI